MLRLYQPVQHKENYHLLAIREYKKATPRAEVQKIGHSLDFPPEIREYRMDDMNWSWDALTWHMEESLIHMHQGEYGGPKYFPVSAYRRGARNELPKYQNWTQALEKYEESFTVPTEKSKECLERALALAEELPSDLGLSFVGLHEVYMREKLIQELRRCLDELAATSAI